MLLVAKPWRGGLARYVFQSLEQLFPGRVEWIATRPVGPAEQFLYRLNKNRWEQLLVDRIRIAERDFAIFINHLPVFSGLEYHSGNVLWLTDGPNPAPGEYAPYAKVFLSDSGYLSNVAAVLPEERLGGELAFACCPETHQWDKPRPESKQLCFIGNKDLKRDSYLESILKTDVSFSVVGNYFFRHSLYWQYPSHFSPPVANERMGGIYANHKLSLNLHAQVVRHGTNMRTFECAAYGIPQLVESRPGLEDFFEPDREVATFKDCDELKEKLSWLLNDTEYRLKMAATAKTRALSEHSYRHRLMALLSNFS